MKNGFLLSAENNQSHFHIRIGRTLLPRYFIRIFELFAISPERAEAFLLHIPHGSPVLLSRTGWAGTLLKRLGIRQYYVTKGIRRRIYIYLESKNSNISPNVMSRIYDLRQRGKYKSFITNRQIVWRIICHILILK